MSFTALQEERETQSAFAQKVFQQIQSFGEAADDEFDVQWASSVVKKASETSVDKNIEINKPEPKQITSSVVFDSANAYSPDSQPQTAVKLEKLNEQQKQQRINPFLVPTISPDDDEYDEEHDNIDVQQVVIL